MKIKFCGNRRRAETSQHLLERGNAISLTGIALAIAVGRTYEAVRMIEELGSFFIWNTLIEHIPSEEQ